MNSGSRPKLATVPTDIKQYRRMLTMLREGHHDFHGTRDLKGVAGLGKILPTDIKQYPGHPATVDRVYHSAGRPDLDYFYGKHPQGGTYHGGFALPQELTKAHERAPDPLINTWVTSDTVPLAGSKGTVLVTAKSRKDPSVFEGADIAQRQLNLRRVDRPAFEAAIRTHDGSLPVSRATEGLVERGTRYRQGAPKMASVEVQLKSPARGAGGRFSGVGHAFTEASKAALQKFALFDNEQNAADLLAHLFRTSNFGYAPRRIVEGRNTTLLDMTWGRETGWFAGGAANYNRPGV